MKANERSGRLAGAMRRNNTRLTGGSPRRIGHRVMAVTCLSLAVLAGCGSTSSSSGSKSAITFGLTGDFSCANAIEGTLLEEPSKAAIYEINHNGGVLGRQLTFTTANNCSDAVDGVTALRQLFIHHPAFVIGPYSDVAPSAIPLFDPNKIVNFTLGANLAYDNMNLPYVYRTLPSDSLQGTAQAVAAYQMGLRSVAIVADNTSDAQAQATVIAATFRRLGGNVTKSVTLAPNLSSYRSEVLDTFNSNPQGVIFSINPQTAATFFAAAGQLNHLNVPYVGDSQVLTANYNKFFGQAAASKYLFSSSPAPASGPAYNNMLADYKAAGVPTTNASGGFEAAAYDAVVVSALAMIDANSANPAKWASKIIDVSDPPGTACFSFVTCSQLLQQHKKINYEGASGPVDFNAHHNVFSAFTTTVMTPTPSVTLTVTPAQVAAAMAQ
jgi:ABC-type branched-subunit amino acid transport system substrate-binding protein